MAYSSSPFHRLPNFSSHVVAQTDQGSSANGERISLWRGVAKEAGMGRGGIAFDSHSWTSWVDTRRFPRQLSISADRRDLSHRLLCPCVRAKRKSAGDRGDASQRDLEELDEDMRQGLNELSNEALKVMLSDNDKMVSELREKVDSLGEYLTYEKQLDAARFMLVVKGMLDHEVLKESNTLQGAYKKAFEKIFSLVEDSGWVLKQAGDDVGGVEMVDDELMPPVLNSQY